MTANRSNLFSGADAAINRVLEAEQAAQREIAECRRKALVILREARSTSRALAGRTDRRINRIHALSDSAINRALADIAIETRMLSDTPEMTDALSKQLDAAINRLIEEVLE
jgi:Mg2+ and Co2+ transporter CorA